MTVIFLHRFDNPLFIFKILPDCLRLAVAEFQHDFPTRFQKRRRLRRNQAIKIQAVSAAIQRARGSKSRTSGWSVAISADGMYGGLLMMRSNPILRRDELCDPQFPSRHSIQGLV